MLGYIGVLLGIALVVYMAFKRVSVIVLTIVGSIVVGLTNKMGFWSIFTDYYLPSAGNWLSSYFIMFVLSGIYARVLSESGSAAAIAYKIVDIFGKKRVLLAMTILVILLTYGGVSGLVSIFLIWPISLVLAKETNKSKTLFLTTFYFGFLTLAYTSLPGTPQLSNVLAAQMLGTSPTAAPVLSIIASVVMFVLGYGYIAYLDKKFEKKGIVFEDNGKGMKMTSVERDSCPPFAVAVIPMLVMLIMFMALSNGWFGITKMGTIIALCSSLIVSTVVCIALNFKRSSNWVAALGQGSQESLGPLVSLFTMVAFSSVVSATPAFKAFINWVISIPGHPYLQVLIASNAIGLVTAAGSTTVQITLNSFAEHWLASGMVNPEALTRIVAISSIGLSCGPHAGGLLANLDVTGESIKDAWWPYFVSCGVVSIIALLVVLGFAMLGVI